MAVENTNSELDARAQVRATRWWLATTGTVSILFCIMLGGLFLINERSKRERAHLFVSGAHVLQQAALELARLKTVVALYAMSPTDQRARQLRVRFEILWSRAELLTEGDEAELLRRSPLVHEFQERLITILYELEPILLKLAESTTADIAVTIDKLAGVEPILRQADQELNDRLIKRLSSEDTNDDRSTALIFGGIAISVALIVLTAAVQALRNERLVERLAQLMKSQARHVENMRNLTEAIPSGVAIVDPDGSIRYTNRTLGLLMEQLGSDSPIATMERIFRGDAIADGVRASGRQVTNPIRILQSPNGSEMAFRLHWADTQWYGSLARIAVVQDYTEVHAAQEKASRAARLAALAGLSTTVAHEINQPLTILGSAAQNTLRRVGSGHAGYEEVAEKLKLILNQIERARSITDRMRLLGDHFGESLSPINLADCVRSSLTLVETTLGEKGITVDLDLPLDGLAPVIGSRQMIEHILMALLMNVCDAFEGSLAPVDCDKRAVYLSLRLEAGYWLLSVADTAGGFAKSVLDHAFEPFVTTKSGWQNVGLGLAFCHAAIRDMGGDIRLRNAGGGATVDIRLQVPAGGAEQVA